jgi:hypothetical protein
LETKEGETVHHGCQVECPFEKIPYKGLRPFNGISVVFGHLPNSAYLDDDIFFYDKESHVHTFFCDKMKPNPCAGGDQ